MTRDAFIRDVTRSEQKCRQHLARAKLALALSTASSQSQAKLRELEALVRLALGSTDDVEHRVTEALTRSLFLDLKANFEFFLWTMCRAWLRHDMVNAMKRVVQVPKKDAHLKRLLREDNLVSLFDSEDGRDFLPAHGLEALTSVLTHMTPGGAVEDGDGWAQIRVAFQVRHLVEHRNGRVDEAFVKAVAGSWGSSSWSRNPHPKIEDVVQVERVDFEATYAAMDLVAQEIASRLRDAWPV